jgi:hypothetical protein
MDKHLEYRSATWEPSQDEDKKTIVGYALVFNQRTVLYKDEFGEEYGEMIERSALDEADMSDVVLRYNHAGRVLARTRNGSLQLAVDDHGLRISADLNGSPEAAGFYDEVRNGLLDKMSFAFASDFSKDVRWDEKTRTRHIQKIRLIADVSIVDFPAYEQTNVEARRAFEELAAPARQKYYRGKYNEYVSKIRELTPHVPAPETLAKRGNVSAEESELSEIYATYCAHSAARDTITEEDVQRAKADYDKIYSRMRRLYYSPDRVEARKANAQKIKAALADHLNGQRFEANPLAKNYSTERNAMRMNTTTTLTTAQATAQNESRNFYDDCLHTRAAGTTGTMSKMIPYTVIQQYVAEHVPGAFFADCRQTDIEHAGDLALPIAALQTIEQHTENAEVETNGFAPSVLVISHKEYVYNTGYSALGATVSAMNFMDIINDTLMSSLLKKIDAVCLEAVAGASYDADNTVTVKTAPTMSDFVSLAGKLGASFIDNAKFYMNSTTYFNWVLGLTGSDGHPVFDPSKKIEDQALLGYAIALDSQIPTGVIYFGDGRRVHLNFAQGMSLFAWSDYDHNTEKAGVRCVAGAAVEPGAFVKMSV